MFFSSKNGSNNSRTYSQGVGNSNFKIFICILYPWPIHCHNKIHYEKEGTYISDRKVKLSHVLRQGTGGLVRTEFQNGTTYMGWVNF